ncbi:MAG: alanine--tRNA ligase [Saprospiraceae bacterium]|nr:alanine--tRNA ligase [Candidatus Opimibacter skivensis]MBP8086434.1 alanine--tRNA ligase [Saprospiraceae bacterium]
MARSAKEIRSIFLAFFEEKQHTIVPSAPMVNKDDPTLMFTNAGMNPFKDYFLGHKPPTHKRIADTQKCLRVSGKHNDLEEVGRDGYHHTMFEMLGNWSFGDYFKREAIDWAWELLTVRLGLPADLIYTSVFGGDKQDGLEEDTEAREFWKQWMPNDRILSFDRKDNFWEMGDTGPCGPCSEIHVDLRSEEERNLIPGADLVNTGHPSVIEIWNLVFMQFNRKADGSLEPLPAKHVDTGMGFERLVRVIQGKTSNYDTDIFAPLIHYVEQATGIPYRNDYSGAVMSDIAMRVLADHVRAVSFGIADGEMPSNTGAGYVLRRILRRAVRYYYTFLDTKEPLMHRLVPLLADFFQDIFPGFQEQKDFVKRVIEQEEISFLRTLEGGIKRFETLKATNKVIAGKDAFELYDTYGFPADLTRLMAAEKGWSIDEAGFDKALQEQKQRSRSDATLATGDWIEVNPTTSSPVFDGYDHDVLEGVKLVKYRSVEDRDGIHYQLVLDRTSFYPEGGGQVGDRGTLSFGNEKIEVVDMIKENDLPIHLAMRLPVDVSASVTTSIDVKRRRLIEDNHSATHLLHAALRDVLGDHVQQRGSLLNEEYLRFDFSHFAKVTPEELQKIETIVNQKIREDIQLKEDRNIPISVAEKSGARMLFGEKYGEKVRMITFDPAYSIELCGGCHVRSTGHIGFFKIISESAVAAGVRRIEAVSADGAEKYVNDQLHQLAQIKSELKNPADPIKSLKELMAEVKDLKQQIEAVEAGKATMIKSALMQSVESINDIRFVSHEVDISDQKLIKQMIYQMGQELGDQSFLLLGSKGDGKAQLTLYISEELVKTKKLHAGNIVKDLAKSIHGGGGGQPFFATAGGTSPEGLKEALERARTFIV